MEKKKTNFSASIGGLYLMVYVCKNYDCKVFS